MIIISPAVRDANNGNWHTAYRWSRFLRERYRVSLATEWSGVGGGASPQCMIALHARRSAASIARFAQAQAGRPLIVVLTGTDLYRDIRSDASARRSLELATHLVVLQDEGIHELAPGLRRKCRTIYQSAPRLSRGTPSRRTFDAVLVGHMRPEKDPLTPMRALQRLAPDSRVRLIHIGEALDEAYLRAARELQARAWPTLKRYLWLGNRPRAETRQRIRRSHVMVLSSVIEGGANVVVEAVTAGVPVLASRIPGNVGMLGRDYAGYFPPGDAPALAALLERASRDRRFLSALCAQCARRAPLFSPARERREAVRLLAEATHSRKEAA
ncbi:MAG TPA: selenoneine biosynthesis selenosugar synthase SenB [Casimicrobiaceae bacterium]|nr:selenoneine biosynthesis selenosugar synthase SenB [Casimicrobiaceae bacterium]